MATDAHARPTAGARDAASLDGVAQLEAVKASFAEALRGPGDVLERDYLLAGYRLRLRSPAPNLLDRLSRAFAHLQTSPGGAPDLAIHVWDSSEGAAPPPTPDVHGEQAPGAFFYYSDARIRAGFQRGTSGDARELSVYPHAPTPALSVLDRERSEGWFWIEDARRVPYWEEATPMRFLLDWWLRDRDVHQLHAGAVGGPDGGVLLVGRSGSGKSTAALSSLESELGYAGDDYVAVSLEPEPWVHSVYCSGKLTADHVTRLPFLLPALSNADQLEREKAVVYVHEHWPNSTAAGFPLRAILVARVVPGAVDARVVETSRLTGLAALAPSTVFQLHTRGGDSLLRMRRLVELVPTYLLELGSDVSSIPTAIASLLRGTELSTR